MLFKYLMFDVDESVNKSNSSYEDPIMSNEPNEDEVKHDPFEFLHDDKIPFSRLLCDMMVWQVQRYNNDDANSNFPLLDDHVQVCNAPPRLYMLQ